MPTNKLVGQAEREREKEKIHDCAYLIPKHLLLPENQRNNTRSLSNYDIVSGGLNATIYQDPEASLELNVQRYERVVRQ